MRSKFLLLSLTLCILPSAVAAETSPSAFTLAVAPSPASVSELTNDALEVLSPRVRTRSHRDALRFAFHAFYEYRADNPGEVRKPYLYFVDYGLDNRTPRGYVFNMEQLTLVEGPFIVAHGRGSSKAKNAVPTKFSNVSGSATTSLGLYVGAELYGFTGKAAGRGSLVYVPEALAQLARVAKGFGKVGRRLPVVLDDQNTHEETYTASRPLTAGRREKAGEPVYGRGLQLLAMVPRQSLSNVVARALTGRPHVESASDLPESCSDLADQRELSMSTTMQFGAAAAASPSSPAKTPRGRSRRSSPSCRAASTRTCARRRRARSWRWGSGTGSPSAGSRWARRRR